MRNIYCIGGLGADERIFRKLYIANAKLVYLNWLKHNEKDNMSSYAARMSALIEEENPVILGVSFGAMLTVEIAKQRKISKGILISGAKNMNETPRLPWLIKWFATSGIIPSFVYKLPHPALYYYFGTENKEERKLVRDVVMDSNGTFDKWALKALLTWENTEVPENIVHIHGKEDRLIPQDIIKADHWIADGGHIMVYNRAEKISRIIEQELERL